MHDGHADGDAVGHLLEDDAAGAVGDCGCDGGIFGESYATCGRIANVIPVDVAVPGCPPTPTALLRGILTAITPSNIGLVREDDKFQTE